MKKFFRKYNMFLFPIFLFIICLGFFSLGYDKVNRIERSFDYNTIYEVTGMVEEIRISDEETILTVAFPDEIEIEFSDGKTMKHAVGDEVSVYTDGIYYEFSEEEVFQKSTKINDYYAIMIFSAFGSIISVIMLILETFVEIRTKKQLKNWKKL